MNTSAIAVVFCVCVLSAKLALSFVPWASRLATLSLLHGIRDRLYGMASQELRVTLVYQDMEFLLCQAIYVVREGDYAQVMAFMEAALRPAAHVDNWRTKAYRESITSLGARVDDLFGLMPLVLIVLMGYLLCQRPIRMVIFTLCLPFALAWAVGKVFREMSMGPLWSLARSVEAAAKSQNVGLAA